MNKDKDRFGPDGLHYYAETCEAVRAGIENYGSNGYMVCAGKVTGDIIALSEDKIQEMLNSCHRDNKLDVFRDILIRILVGVFGTLRQSNNISSSLQVNNNTFNIRLQSLDMCYDDLVVYLSILEQLMIVKPLSIKTGVRMYTLDIAFTEVSMDYALLDVMNYRFIKSKI